MTRVRPAGPGARRRGGALHPPDPRPGTPAREHIHASTARMSTSAPAEGRRELPPASAVLTPRGARQAAAALRRRTSSAAPVAGAAHGLRGPACSPPGAPSPSRAWCRGVRAVVVAFVVEQDLPGRGLATVANMRGPFAETVLVDERRRDGRRGDRGAPTPRSRCAGPRSAPCSAGALGVRYPASAVETTVTRRRRFAADRARALDRRRR